MEDAGGVGMSDSCPSISRFMPKGTRVTATDSAEQAHYLPALTGVQTWFGSVAHCIDAAVTGRWNGELRQQESSSWSGMWSEASDAPKHLRRSCRQP